MGVAFFFAGAAVVALVVLLVAGACGFLNDTAPIGDVTPSAYAHPRGTAYGDRPRQSSQVSRPAPEDDDALVEVVEHDLEPEQRGDSDLEPAPVDLDDLATRKAA